MGRKLIPREVKRGVIYKKCGLCGLYRPTTEYWPSRSDSSVDHLQGYCKDCKIHYQRVYRKYLREQNEWVDYKQAPMASTNRSERLLSAVAKCNLILKKIN